MLGNFEEKSAMRKSADLLGSADYLRENQYSPSLEQLNYKTKQLKEQNKSREKIDNQEHSKADSDLENDIENLDKNIITTENLKGFIDENFAGNLEAFETAIIYLNKQLIFSRNVSSEELISKLKISISENKEISTADKIKNTKLELDKQGKSQIEILEILISKYENEEAVSTWVNNWKNFLKLHQFAENKPPIERQAIQKIIANADFTDENAFNTSLVEITNNAEISDKTKLEISREFNGANISSVAEVDNGLKLMKARKNEITQVLDNKKNKADTLNSELDNLETELKALPLDSPKRTEIETKIEQKKEILEKTETTIEKLDKENAKDVSFILREGIKAKLNNDGSRSIRILSEDFNIRLPSNRLPFTNTKNTRSVNLAFSYLALREQNIADVMFSPDLKNNSVPTKSQRKMAHTIFEALGIDDVKILSKEKIKQFKSDFALLTNSQDSKTNRECLIELGIYDVYSQNIDINKLKKCLKFIKENNGLPRGFVYETMKDNYKL